jgi:hypothetical protein
MSRSNHSSLSQPWFPSEAWSAAFARECTKQLYDDARRFATWRARAVGSEGGLADEYYTRELAQNALADTATGVLRWNPTEKTLREHVLDAIRTRTNHDRVRAKRYRHEAIDVFDPEASDELLGEIETALADRAASANPERATLVAEWLAELCTHAAPSSGIRRLLDAYKAGATTTSDVMHFTGMSEKEYDAARLRLDRLVERLSPHLRSARRTARKRA